MTTARYMLDTNIVSDLVRNPHGVVFDKITEVGSDAVCISIITAAELRYGCAKRGSAKLLNQVEAIMEGLDIVPLEVPADTEYGVIRAELEVVGKPIGPNDLLIAAHAYALGTVLVTANVDEFSRVRRLKLENWLA
jgi:tRNA(fMet)-specific endonuclease VapC